LIGDQRGTGQHGDKAEGDDGERDFIH
jgi:hypothetical protein